MNATEWRIWFIQQRIELHDLLVAAMRECSDVNQKAEALYEHDITLGALAKHAGKRIVRADLVAVLARRSEET